MLSEVPGNVVYHLVTLLSLQVVFAIARGHWKRNPADEMARRMAWAAALIFLLRVAQLLVGLALSDAPKQAALLLPPLESVSHTVVATMIVWALVEHSRRFPRLGDSLLLIVMLIVGVMAVFFVEEWRTAGIEGTRYYESNQATVWSIVQISVIGAGLIWTLFTRRLRYSLSPMILALLLLAHIASWQNYPELLPAETDIAFWVRLGHLIVFPLWAALAFRRSMLPLLVAQQSSVPFSAQLENALTLSTQVIRASRLEEVMPRVIDLVSRTIDARLVGVALFDETSRQHVHLTSNLPQAGQDQPRSWDVDLYAWPVFRTAVEQGDGVQLVPNGLGARQLLSWYEHLGIAPMGPMLIQPPLSQASAMAFLLLAGPKQGYQWLEEERRLAVVLAEHVSQAIDNCLALRLASPQAATIQIAPDTDKAVSGRLIALEDERNRFAAELATVRSRLERAENDAALSSQRARDLAATLEELEQLNRETKVMELEAEIESLRESLIEAEEAMALAAAGESGLSTEWVMLTITRYSGELEEAQAKIHSLEGQLEQWERGPVNRVVASLAQELRTPMTSIAGYTDLLLGEKMGILGEAQRDFVQRIKANSERLGTLLEQIVQMTTAREQAAPPTKSKEQVDVQEVIEAAISAIIAQVREKKLLIDLDIGDPLPPLYVNRSALFQIMTSLLGNACQSSASDCSVTISAHSHVAPIAGDNGHAETVEYLKLAVTDSGGGIGPGDRLRVFDPHHRAENPLISGVGDTGVALSVARTLTEENGGRIWVDSEVGVGSTFSTLFPVSPPETANAAQVESNLADADQVEA